VRQRQRIAAGVDPRLDAPPVDLDLDGRQLPRLLLPERQHRLVRVPLDLVRLFAERGHDPAQLPAADDARLVEAAGPPVDEREGRGVAPRVEQPLGRLVVAEHRGDPAQWPPRPTVLELAPGGEQIAPGKGSAAEHRSAPVLVACEAQLDHAADAAAPPPPPAEALVRGPGG
jgi:hypothetical protein